MKKLLPFLIVSCTAIGMAQTPCENGFAGSFPCEGYDLQSQIPLSTMNSTRANDSWGWTDPQDQKEYAIICLIEGTAFIDISDPINPVYLGQILTENNSSTWRDAKVYNNHAFIVSEDPGHGMQVFDLTRLRDVISPPVIFTPDTHFTGFGGAHNIVINEESGYAYAVGTSAFSGGAYFINIQDPVNPMADGGYSSTGYTHDAHVVNYTGPDNDYTGQEIMVASNEDELVIVDVTNKSNPQLISTITYPNVSYTHQGWFTEDQRYFLLGDETDEIDFGINSRTIVVDLSDLDNPALHFDYSGPSAATDHNGYVNGDNFYLSNNAAGLRVIDISEVANQNMTEIGYFDSFPGNNEAGFNGAWSIYPFFESGNIVISDRTSGFLLVKKSDILATSEFDATLFAVVPNPATSTIEIISETEIIETLTIVDTRGRLVHSEENIAQKSITLDITRFSKGMYFVNINNLISKKLLKN